MGIERAGVCAHVSLGKGGWMDAGFWVVGGSHKRNRRPLVSCCMRDDEEKEDGRTDGQMDGSLCPPNPTSLSSSSSLSQAASIQSPSHHKPKRTWSARISSSTPDILHKSHNKIAAAVVARSRRGVRGVGSAACRRSSQPLAPRSRFALTIADGRDGALRCYCRQPNAHRPLETDACPVEETYAVEFGRGVSL